jgi:hypothetical protein
MTPRQNYRSQNVLRVNTLIQIAETKRSVTKCTSSNALMLNAHLQNASWACLFETKCRKNVFKECSLRQKTWQQNVQK